MNRQREKMRLEYGDITEQRLMNKRSQSGSSLAIALFMTSSVALTLFTLIYITSSSQNEVSREQQSVQAQMFAERAFTEALSELNLQIDYDQYGIGTVYKTIDGSEYFTQLKIVNGNPTIIATAVINPNSLEPITESIEVTLTAPGGGQVPIPGFNGKYSSIALNGPIQQGTFEFNLDLNPFVADGFDTSGANDVPAISIEDPDMYIQVMDQIAEAINDGHVSENDFIGTNVTHYTSTTGIEIDISNDNPNDPGLSSNFYQAIMDNVKYGITNKLIPKTKNVMTGANVEVEQNIDLTGDSDAITLIYADNLEVTADITGEGTLIIHGNVEIASSGSINWDGDVIIIPKLEDEQGNPPQFPATVTLIHGDGTVTENYPSSQLSPIEHETSLYFENSGSINFKGSTIMLSDEAETKMELKSTVGNQNVFDGSLLLLSNGTGKVDFESKVGGEPVHINGIFSTIGDSVKMEVKNNGFDVDGTFVAAVPNDGAQQKVELEFKTNSSFKFHSENVQNAINGLLEFTSTLEEYNPFSGGTYSIVSWKQSGAHAINPAETP